MDLNVSFQTVFSHSKTVVYGVQPIQDLIVAKLMVTPELGVLLKLILMENM